MTDNLDGSGQVMPGPDGQPKLTPVGGQGSATWVVLKRATEREGKRRKSSTWICSRNVPGLLDGRVCLYVLYSTYLDHRPNDS